MNPLLWKREHQIAFYCAIALGCIIGLFVGFHEAEFSTFRWGRLYCESRSSSCLWLLNGYWLQMMGWTLLGGAIGAALVYIRQLLRT
jgi:hypothetical protein